MSAPAPAAAAFGLCTCGHPIYDHARRVVPNAGIKEYVGCRIDRCPCETFAASDGSKWPAGPAGGAGRVSLELVLAAFVLTIAAAFVVYLVVLAGAAGGLWTLS